MRTVSERLVKEQKERARRWYVCDVCSRTIQERTDMVLLTVELSDDAKVLGKVLRLMHPDCRPNYRSTA